MRLLTHLLEFHEKAQKHTVHYSMYKWSQSIHDSTSNLFRFGRIAL